MADYTSEINSAYADIQNAGASITIGMPMVMGFDPVTEQSDFYEGDLSEILAIDAMSVEVINMTGIFGDAGLIQIGNEAILYSGNDSGILTILARGYNDTVAEAHPVTDKVYFLWELNDSYGLLKDVKQNDIDGTSIKVGDKIFLVPSKTMTFTPNTSCRIRQGSFGWGIVNVTILEPGGDSILYYLHARKFHADYPGVPISIGLDKQIVVFGGIETLLNGVECVW